MLCSSASQSQRERVPRMGGKGRMDQDSESNGLPELVFMSYMRESVC